MTIGVLLLPQEGMLVHRRLPPGILSGYPNSSLVSIYAPGWRKAPSLLLYLIIARGKVEQGTMGALIQSVKASYSTRNRPKKFTSKH